MQKEKTQNGEEEIIQEINQENFPELKNMNILTKGKGVLNGRKHPP